MGTRTISITDEAYKRLATLKGINESFSIVIERVTGKTLLSNVQGILSEKSANELEQNIAKNRKEHMKLRKKRLKKIEKDFI